MNDFVSQVVVFFAFIFVIGFLVFIHELGHFLAAKIVGIKVLEFAIGMGPKLCGFKKGDTEFNLRLLPIGGYVNLYGEGDYDLIEPNSYGGKNPYQRIFVLFAGVLMNFLFVVAYFYISGFFVDFEYRNIEYGFNSNSNPWFGKKENYGFLVFNLKENSVLNNKVDSFDILVSVNDLPINKGVNLYNLVTSSDKLQLKFVDYNSNAEKVLTIDKPNILNEYKKQLIVIKHIFDDSPLKGQVNVGDIILSINSNEYDLNQFKNLLNQNKGSQIKFTLINTKDNRLYDVNFALPDKDLPLGIVYTTTYNLDFLLGVDFAPVSFIKYEGFYVLFSGFGQALNYVQFFIDSFRFILSMSFKSGSPLPIVDNMAGVIGIFQVLERMISLFGLWGIFELMALFSINLAVINLLPIPALDGGHILFTLLEIITRKRLNTKFYNFITYIGFAFLMSLMILVNLSDLVKFTNLRDFFCNNEYQIPIICSLSDFRR